MHKKNYDVCIRKKIHVKGLVQGVGFRPFVYRLANELKIKGNVENRNDGVHIIAVASPQLINDFIARLQSEAPVASNIESITTTDADALAGAFDKFEIVKSLNTSDEVTEISPDIAVCNDCLDDLVHQPHRIDYPFINCTNCGPRFTIIEDLPYDRDKTTMKDFVMCNLCYQEYRNVADRRFHAQPVACNDCGPEYELFFNNEHIKDIHTILEKCSLIIESGKIIAMKGLGGFHLACDAMKSEAVSRMRQLKNREAKPFAVMFSTFEKAETYCNISEAEKKSLLSWRRPVVLLSEKPGSAVSKEVSLGLGTLGVMLPYMPFHHLLFRYLKTDVIVLTSGNISDEPIVIDNEEAKNKLVPLSDALLVYNRDIYNRTDDSVVFIANGKERIIRRSRGYVPNPVKLGFNADGIFAAGAELKNCFCYGKGESAIMSQHIGDIKTLGTFEFYKETAAKFQKLFRVSPKHFACDMHPDYLSSRYTDEISNGNSIRIQHHHAHIASCMAEHGLDERVIGISFDGTGYGDDGNIWGSEFMVCDFKKYTRITHFDYLPLPGGDKAADEPWRMAVSYLYNTYGEEFLNLELPLFNSVPKDKIRLIIEAISKKMNCPLTSGAGRLFDAVASISGICYENRYEAEAPMLLEAMADHSVTDSYSFTYHQTIDFKPAIREMVNDVIHGISKSTISAKFHNMLTVVIIMVAKEIREKTKLNKVVLSGGVFQNRFLLENSENIFIQNKFEVFTHSKVPSNDGGIALGQLAVASKKLKVEG